MKKWFFGLLIGSGALLFCWVPEAEGRLLRNRLNTKRTDGSVVKITEYKKVVSQGKESSTTYYTYSYSYNYSYPQSYSSGNRLRGC